MEPIISKEELDELMSLEGKGRGVLFKTASKFILKEKGEEGLKELEETITNLGYPIKFQEIRAMDFYPMGLYAVTLVTIQRLFNFNEEKFIEMGRYESKISIIIRLFIRYFFSIDIVVKQVSKMWRTYFSIGDINVTELDKEKKYGVLKVENFRFHPIHCQILKGYLPSVVQMVVGSKVISEETRCPFRGDEYHEFSLKW